MQRYKVIAKTTLKDNFKIAAISSLYGFAAKEVYHEAEACLPEWGDSWQIGAIIGPSGSGKSLLAKKWGGDNYWKAREWSELPVVEAIGDFPLEKIIEMFTTLGFSSVPSWCKPYTALSMGERMRVDLAAALLDKPALVFDEFTSVVDRHCAKIISLALGRAIRRDEKRKFVAVACHEDFIEELNPAWVLRLPEKEARFRSGEKRSHPFRFICRNADKKEWDTFRHFHYLDTTIHKAARCFACEDEKTGKAVAFCGIIPSQGWKGRDRVTRIVVLPDYQGIGIGRRFLNATAKEHAKTGRTLSLVTAHFGFSESLKRDKCWQLKRMARLGSSRNIKDGNDHRNCYLNRASFSFVYKGEQE